MATLKQFPSDEMVCGLDKAVWKARKATGTDCVTVQFWFWDENDVMEETAKIERFTGYGAFDFICDFLMKNGKQADDVCSIDVKAWMKYPEFELWRAFRKW